MKFFHRHTFDGTAWKKVDEVAINSFDHFAVYTWSVGGDAKLPEQSVVEKRTSYSNTCLTCGELVSKTIIT